MNEGQFTQIQGWFENLNRKMEGLDIKMVAEIGDIRENMVTKQQFENRFQALLAATMNLHERVEGYRDQTDTEIRIMKRALHDIEEELKHTRNR